VGQLLSPLNRDFIPSATKAVLPVIRLQLCYHFLLSQILDLRAERILPRVKLDYLDAWPSPSSSVVTPRRICGKPQRALDHFVRELDSLVRKPHLRAFKPLHFSHERAGYRSHE
jgi:hypothetical protein